jgi:hypothetical protein
VLLSAILMFANFGCGDTPDGPELSPASGVVTLDGAPLKGVSVSFRADAAKGNTTPHIPSGTADDGGRYELTTVNRAGAPPGWYKVVIIPATPPATGVLPPKTGPAPFDEKYTAEETTDLSVEVKADATAETSYDLKLTK